MAVMQIFLENGVCKNRDLSAQQTVMRVVKLCKALYQILQFVCDERLLLFTYEAEHLMTTFSASPHF